MELTNKRLVSDRHNLGKILSHQVDMNIKVFIGVSGMLRGCVSMVAVGNSRMSYWRFISKVSP